MEFFTQLLNAKEILSLGIFVIVIIVYAENGLFFGFFLPGDYLLFLSGLFCYTGALPVDIVTLLLSVTGAAIMGSYTGYAFGWFLGHNLLTRKDTWLFKKEYLERTRSYFLKYGGKTLIISRFLPVVRTFAPILAGIIKMDFKQFTLFNVLGGFIWVFSLILAGYFLGKAFPDLAHHVDYVIYVFIALTGLVFLKGYLGSKKKPNVE